MLTSRARSSSLVPALAYLGGCALPLALGAAGCGSDDATDDAAVARDDAFVITSDTGAPVDGGASRDDAAGPGADAPSSADAAPGSDAPTTSGCGGMRPDVSGITGTEGLVIARDGSLYYSQRGAVGRVSPSGEIDDAFAMLPRGATQVWGMVPDAANEHLYVGSPSTGTIYDVDLSTAAVSALVTGVGGPNGLTLGPDGALYFSDFLGDRVMRVALTAGAAPTLVGDVPSANGIAFDDAGRLLVCNYGEGALVRLTLEGGRESSRETIATRLGRPDGVALDRDGTIYVTDNSGGRLLSLASDGTPTPLLTGVGAAASLDFGAGALDCEDLYVASSGAMRRYEMGTVPGRGVPWQ